MRGAISAVRASSTRTVSANVAASPLNRFREHRSWPVLAPNGTVQVQLSSQGTDQRDSLGNRGEELDGFCIGWSIVRDNYGVGKHTAGGDWLGEVPEASIEYTCLHGGEVGPGATVATVVGVILGVLGIAAVCVAAASGMRITLGAGGKAHATRSGSGAKVIVGVVALVSSRPSGSP